MFLQEADTLSLTRTPLSCVQPVTKHTALYPKCTLAQLTLYSVQSTGNFTGAEAPSPSQTASGCRPSNTLGTWVVAAGTADQAAAPPAHTPATQTAAPAPGLLVCSALWAASEQHQHLWMKASDVRNIETEQCIIILQHECLQVVTHMWRQHLP